MSPDHWSKLTWDTVSAGGYDLFDPIGYLDRKRDRAYKQRVIATPAKRMVHTSWSSHHHVHILWSSHRYIATSPLPIIDHHSWSTSHGPAITTSTHHGPAIATSPLPIKVHTSWSRSHGPAITMSTPCPHITMPRHHHFSFLLPSSFSHSFSLVSQACCYSYCIYHVTADNYYNLMCFFSSLHTHHVYVECCRVLDVDRSIRTEADPSWVAGVYCIDDINTVSTVHRRHENKSVGM